MPSSPSPSSSVQRARQSLADRLRELRQAAELSGTDLAAAVGWHKSKVSRIEKAVQPVTQADIRAWCDACNAQEQADDLTASLRAAEGGYVEWRRLEPTGLRKLQESYVPLYEQTRWMRVYQPHVIPGLFQTAGYARALLGAITEFRNIPNDVEAAVEARLGRRRVLTTGGHTFVFLIEQCVLDYRIGEPEVMADQLRHLLQDMSLPSVSVGIIPADAPRPMWATEGFTVYDTSQVQIELLTANVTVSVPSELNTYFKAFDELSALAVYGSAARELVAASLRALGAD
ncbi:helix-turn-helix transcriptional regulator [Actinomadura sp. NEAU-AAG7]|uniref:helix-turn-helix domain-containing protein n=1 Tax=Actinomadura sp. NEAU-AAG7 TaxID=2839640 RepID=UPI001BE4B630|nr:helix-turn-helix transcriptional regulator [Actinomadura sp. NEAU-AAG7]MBT2210472.1 helix-turn-helix domain-containing protein [Actinomadura sp. NEAU-AAG7]